MNSGVVSKKVAYSMTGADERIVGGKVGVEKWESAGGSARIGLSLSRKGPYTGLFMKS